MVRSGGSRPLTSYILQEFLRFADSWGTRLSLFFAMTGSFIHILVGLGPRGVTGLVVFNLVIFCLSIASSLYAYNVDPGLNTVLILYAALFSLTYFTGLVSLFDLPDITGGSDPLGAMETRLDSQGYVVDSFSEPGSDIPSFTARSGATTYSLHCLHNERYDANYFETRVEGDVIGEVRDNGYHCKIESKDTNTVPPGLESAITGEDDQETSDEERDETRQGSPTNEVDAPDADSNTTQDADASNESEEAKTEDDTNQTVRGQTGEETADKTRLDVLKERIDQEDFAISLKPDSPVVDERVEATFQDSFASFGGDIKWYVQGMYETRGYPGYFHFDDTGPVEVTAKLHVDGEDVHLRLAEETAVVGRDDHDSSAEETSSDDEGDKGGSVVVEPVPEDPRIAYWCGKVNQHRENGEWQTDPDGLSGCDKNKVNYCQRFYPETSRVVEAGEEQISGWKKAGNTGSATAMKMTYRCVQP